MDINISIINKIIKFQEYVNSRKIIINWILHDIQKDMIIMTEFISDVKVTQQNS